MRSIMHINTFKVLCSFENPAWLSWTQGCQLAKSWQCWEPDRRSWSRCTRANNVCPEHLALGLLHLRVCPSRINPPMQGKGTFPPCCSTGMLGRTCTAVGMVGRADSGRFRRVKMMPASCCPSHPSTSGGVGGKPAAYPGLGWHRTQPHAHPGENHLAATRQSAEAPKMITVLRYLN